MFLLKSNHEGIVIPHQSQLWYSNLSTYMAIYYQWTTEGIIPHWSKCFDQAL